MEEISISDNNEELISKINFDNNDLKEEIYEKKDCEKNNNNKYKIPTENKGFKNDIYENSNIFSKLFFYWGYKILKLTSKYKIEVMHLGKLEKKNDSKFYFYEINHYWEVKKYKKRKIWINKGIFKSKYYKNNYSIFIKFI